MQFNVRPIDEEAVQAIAGWHYPPPYDFNDWTKDPDDLGLLLDAQVWPERFFSVHDESGELVGFYEFTLDGDWATIGLGLRPDLTGQGLGLSFVNACLAFARSYFKTKHFHLTVATFNERAITVYERAGFTRDEIIPHFTNGALHDFLHMRRRESAGDQPGIASPNP